MKTTTREMMGDVARAAMPTVFAALTVAFGAMAVHGCGARQPASVAADTFLNCEAGNLVTAAADLVPFGIAKVTSWISGDGVVDKTKMMADLGAIHSDLAKCVIAAAVAAVDEITARRTLVAGPGLRDAFTVARGELAWARVRVSGTTF